MRKNVESNIHGEYYNAREVYDVTIIGGGAVGLFTAFYSGLRGMKTELIEASRELGGKVTMGYPQKTISDICGIKEITVDKLGKELIAQAKTFDPKVICNQWIKDLQKLENGTFRLTSQT